MRTSKFTGNLTGAGRHALLLKAREVTKVALARAAVLDKLPPSPAHLGRIESSRQLTAVGDSVLKIIEASAQAGEPDDVRILVDCLLAVGRWAAAASRHEAS